MLTSHTRPYSRHTARIRCASSCILRRDDHNYIDGYGNCFAGAHKSATFERCPRSLACRRACYAGLGRITPGWRFGHAHTHDAARLPAWPQWRGHVGRRQTLARGDSKSRRGPGPGTLWQRRSPLAARLSLACPGPLRPAGNNPPGPARPGPTRPLALAPPRTKVLNHGTASGAVCLATPDCASREQCLF